MSTKSGIGKELRTGGFIKAYLIFSRSERANIRLELCSICYWNPATFSKKLSGERSFRIDEIDKVTDFFASKGIVAWTGEPINAL